MRRGNYSLVLAATALGAAAPSLSAQSATTSDKVETTTLVALAKPGLLPFVLRDGRTVDGVRDGKTSRLVINGEPVGPVFKGLPSITLSRDERHFVAWGGSEGKIVLALDGRFQEVAPGISPPALQFSDDGSAVAYRVCRAAARNQVTCETGLVGQAPDPAVTHWPVVVTGGERPAIRAHVAARDNSFVVVFDGKDNVASKALALPAAGNKKAYLPIAGLSVAPGGKRLGFVAWGDLPMRDSSGAVVKIPNSVAVVVDDQAGEPFSMVGPIVWSPDGSRYAYAGVDNRAHRWKWDSSVRLGRVVVDGVAGHGFEVSGTLPERPTMPEGDLPLILHGLAPEWTGVSNPVFSSDSRRIAYVARRGKDDFVVILDSAAIATPRLERVLGGPVFSPDSRHVAFVGYANRAAQLYVDGNAVGEGVGARWASRAEALTFDPTSRRVAFVLAEEAPAPFKEPFPGWFGNWTEEARVSQTLGFEMTQRSSRRFVLDGSPGPEFTSYPLRTVWFSPNGEHAAHHIDNKGVVVVRDGVPGPNFRRFFPLTFALDNDGVATYMAGDDRGIVKVRQGGK